MKDNENKFIAAIAKLIKLTQEGGLDWEVTKPPDALNESLLANEKVGSVFLTKYKNDRLRLYEIEETVSHADVSGSGFRQYLGRGGSRYYRLKRSVLEIIDEEGQVLWSFPPSKALDDLLSAAQYQVFKVNDFFDSLLNDR